MAFDAPRVTFQQTGNVSFFIKSLNFRPGDYAG